MKCNKHLPLEVEEFLTTQYQKYIKETPMTKKEMKVLREWVKDGHSVYENTCGAWEDGQVERIETDILNNFKVLGALAEPLHGVKRLEILHNILNMDTKEPFRFRYDMLPKSGLNTKDFIAPTGFDFSSDSTFKMGVTYGGVSYLQITAPELTDKMLAEFLEIEESLIVNIHIQSIDQREAIKSLKMTLSNIQKMKIEEQKKAVRSGYDMDIIPTDIATYGEEAQNLLDELQSRNEKMFRITFIIMNTAKSKKKLENLIFQVNGIAQKYNCNLRVTTIWRIKGLQFNPI